MVTRLELLFVGMDIKDEAEKRKRALLLHYAGEQVFEIYEARKGDTEETYDATKQVLTSYFSPQKNAQMDIYKFRTCKQKDTQTLDQYVTELSRLGKTCNFNNIDTEILSQVIQNCKSNRLRRRALREPDIKLGDLLTLGRTLEIADTQAHAMEMTPEQTVNKIKQKFSPNSRGRGKRGFRTNVSTSGIQRQSSQVNNRNSTSSTCHNCGGSYPHSAECPAKGKMCNYCHKYNHFKKVCRKREKDNKHKGNGHVHEIQEQEQHNGMNYQQYSSDDDDYCYRINIHSVNSQNNRTPKLNLKINGIDCNILIDTGASVNILDENTYNRLGSPKLSDRKPHLVPYGGGSRLLVIGTCMLAIESNGRSQDHVFCVVKGNYGALVGYPTCCDLNLVQLVNRVSTKGIVDKYPDLFTGIGKLKNRSYRIHIDDSVPPVVQNNRRTPFHLRSKVETEIRKLLDQDIIEKVNGQHTPWVSPIVTPPKKDPEQIRLCIDMREPNKAILRERHLMPTVDELIHDLNGATVFSKLDLRSGYHQLELEESSRYITTFNTHMGIYRYKRLNFGISTASEIFQEAIRGVIQGIQNAKNLSDDIIVYGKTQTEHDTALDATFKALSDSGFKLNREKCEFNRDRITFFGVVFSHTGISPDPKKIHAIREAKPPQDVKELRSFLGLTAFCSRFIQNYSLITEPLRILTRDNMPWIWGEDQVNSFNLLKLALSSDTVIAYFDPSKEIEVIVDASPIGLAGILSQESKVVAYASRSLTDVESRYSQTEREALAIVWACEHFDMYLRGCKYFTVITDHKPLERIWQRPKPSLRIERWGFRLQPYKFTIKYSPGRDNPADYMSRHPIEQYNTSREEKIADAYVNFVATQAVPKAMTLDEVKGASAEDATITKAIEFVRTGRWFELKKLTDPALDILELQAYRSIRDELVVHSDNVLLRNDRIVLPQSLRSRAVDLAHEGHQGISRTKAHLRSKVWFPGLNESVESRLRSCIACQALTDRPNRIEPYKMSDLPSGPWEFLSADFCGPLPTGEYIFVVTDEYSRYPVVEITKSVSAGATIPVLDKIISCFGIPRTIKTDNGSPFNSNTFRSFVTRAGIDHRKITQGQGPILKRNLSINL